MDSPVTKEQNLVVCCEDITYSSMGIDLHGCNGKYPTIMNASNIIERPK